MALQQSTFSRWPAVQPKFHLQANHPVEDLSSRQERKRMARARSGRQSRSAFLDGQVPDDRLGVRCGSEGQWRGAGARRRRTHRSVLRIRRWGRGPQISCELGHGRCAHACMRCGMKPLHRRETVSPPGLRGRTGKVLTAARCRTSVARSILFPVHCAIHGRRAGRSWYDARCMDAMQFQ